MIRTELPWRQHIAPRYSKKALKISTLSDTVECNFPFVRTLGGAIEEEDWMNCFVLLNCWGWWTIVEKLSPAIFYLEIQPQSNLLRDLISIFRFFLVVSSPVKPSISELIFCNHKHNRKSYSLSTKTSASFKRFLPQYSSGWK